MKVKGKIEKITISEEQKIKFVNAAQREAEMEAGLRVDRHRVFKNKKKYNRKDEKREAIRNDGFFCLYFLIYTKKNLLALNEYIILEKRIKNECYTITISYTKEMKTS